MTDPVVQFLAELAKLGILGLLLTISLLWHWRQQKIIEEYQKLLKEVQEKRTSDAQAVVDKVLQLSGNLGDNIQKLVSWTEILERSVGDVRGLLLERMSTSGTFRIMAPPTNKGGEEG